MTTKPCPICNGTGSIAVRFGERVRMLREQYDMTQEQMSKACGLGRAQIANIEADRSDPTPHTLIVLARRFAVTTDWLLGLDAQAMAKEGNDRE